MTFNDLNKCSWCLFALGVGVGVGVGFGLGVADGLDLFVSLMTPQDGCILNLGGWILGPWWVDLGTL